MQGSPNKQELVLSERPRWWLLDGFWTEYILRSSQKSGSLKLYKPIKGPLLCHVIYVESKQLVKASIIVSITSKVYLLLTRCIWDAKVAYLFSSVMCRRSWKNDHMQDWTAGDYLWVLECRECLHAVLQIGVVRTLHLIQASRILQRIPLELWETSSSLTDFQQEEELIVLPPLCLIAAFSWHNSKVGRPQGTSKSNVH